MEEGSVSFLNQTAVVTGGSRGIGRAICLELASHGANIVLCYAGNEQAAEQTAQDCRALGARVTAVKCDVSDNQAVKDMMKAAVKEYGRIDILVNNAGVTRDGFLLMMRESDYDTVLDTNLKGTFLCMKHVVHAMMKQNYGRIVNLSSVSGIRGNAGQANYAASKAGVVGLTKAAANAVAPGFIETDMTAAMTDAAKAATLAMIPAARLGQAQEVARAVVFLAGKDAAYITGQVLCVDGGMAM